jgi:hypothetical protein
VTRAELLEVVFRFYPRVVPSYDPRYKETEEYRRLVDASRHAALEYPTWKAMIRRLGDRYPLADDSVRLLANWIEPAYSAHIYLATRTLGFHVSLLGPYYGIHRTGEPDEEPVASDIAREIEATYPGCQRIPPELGNVLVPEVLGLMAGPATIHLCLLSEEWTRHPVPLP